MTKSVHLCELCCGFSLVTSVLILFKKKQAALEDLYVSCQMSSVKVACKVPSVVLISQRMKTNGPCLDVNLNSALSYSAPHYWESYHQISLPGIF